MPRTPNPVQPRRLDERHYEQALRRIVLEPLMRKLRAGLTRAAAAADVLDAIRGVPVDTSRTDLLVADEVAAQARRLRSYHTRRLIQTFRAALGIDIRPTLQDAAIEPLMAAWRRENIRLVKTIPERLHESLYRRVSETFTDRPFDRGALSQMLNREFKSSGYNVRRLARDQTSKAIGQLTRTRHQQLGITEYTWRTAQDERVRDSHVALEGSRQRWDTPPSVGHPGEDIQCRCVAIPIISTRQPGGAVEEPLFTDSPSAEGLTRESFVKRTDRTYVKEIREQHRRHPQFRPDDSLPPGVRAYKGFGYEDLNKGLRDRELLPKNLQRVLLEVDTSTSPLRNRHVVFRGVEDPPDWQLGDRERWLTPTSTSADVVTAMTFSGNDTLLELHPAPGTRALVYNVDEAEIVFALGQTLEVLAVHRDIEIGDLGKVRNYVIGRIRP